MLKVFFSFLLLVKYPTTETEQNENFVWQFPFFGGGGGVRKNVR